MAMEGESLPAESFLWCASLADSEARQETAWTREGQGRAMPLSAAWDSQGTQPRTSKGLLRDLGCSGTSVAWEAKRMMEGPRDDGGLISVKQDPHRERCVGQGREDGQA